MKRFLLVLFVIGLAVVSCLKPPHNNEWDPENPDKAILRGCVYGLNDQPVPNAEVFLMQDEEVTDSAISDADGSYELAGIDPGIYKLVARALHFLPWECEPESLPAGTDTTINIYFCAQYYDFEDENPGTVIPFGFDTLGGTWAVVNDETGPERHSIPNVYHGEKTGSKAAFALLKFSAPDFHLETTFKVLNNSGDGWLTGAIFGYHADPLNYYFVAITHMGVGLNKVINGVVDTLQVVPHMFPTDTWFDLSITMCGLDIYVCADGAELTYTDTIPFSGRAGLWVDNTAGSAFVNFDDVIIGR